MASGWWDKPVPVMIGGSTTHHVTRPNTAADILLHDWPSDGGPACTKAMTALLKALGNPANDSLNAAARKAFEEAAREAGILAG